MLFELLQCVICGYGYNGCVCFVFYDVGMFVFGIVFVVLCVVVMIVVGVCFCLIYVMSGVSMLNWLVVGLFEQ